tara:strand:+ start:303 stop:638 length:336 start_codon:yes stop_codon:yes gene_type:complete
MPNKHYCQGPNCHTKSTKDRWQKSTGKLRGRYASWTIDNDRGYYEYMKLFCSQGCANEWLNDHADNIANRRPIPFITERRVAEGIYGIREKSNEYYTYKTLQRLDTADDVG